MKSFPMFLRTTGRRIVIVGGGEQAAQKARLLIRTDAALTILAPEVEPELTALVLAGRAEQFGGPLTPALFADTLLVFIGTGCPAYDACAHALAKEAGALINVVDQPSLCDATTPSIVDRDPVVVAIGTEGNAPVLGRAIKTQIETLLDPRIGAYAALAGRLRDAVSAKVPRSNRRAFWRWAFQDAPWRAFQRGDDRAAAAILKSAIEAGGTGETGGCLSVLGGADAAADLMTLRAVARLQEADVIFYPPGMDPLVLDLARRDAQRVIMGQGGAQTLPGLDDWAPVLGRAREGLRVVRLMSGRAEVHLTGDPRAMGVEIETIPGPYPHHGQDQIDAIYA